MKTSKTLAKIISLALVICMLFSLASCNLFKGKLELKSFTVDRSSVKTAYYLGEKIDFSGIKAYVKYSDSSLDKEYTYSELTITYAPDITATEGQKEVKVSFQDPNLDTEVSATVLITVTEDPNAIKHDSYKVDATGMKTTYLIGDTLDFTGVKVIEKFTNGGADVEMTDLSTISYEYDSNITATPGIKTVLVKYNGEDAGSISITVNRPGINEATLDTTGVTLEYLVGQTVSFTGLKATITYENGQTATVTDFTFKTDLTTLTATVGEKTVLVEYTDALSGTTGSASFKVKVDGVVDYTIDTSDMTREYLEGETVSFAGIKVTAHYNFGKTESVAFSALTFVHADNLTATVGSKPVTVKVGDVEVGTIIIVVGDIPTATANTQGVKLSYLVGETVSLESLEGLTVTLTFTDGTPSQTLALADLEVDLTGLTATAGTKTITVKYQFDAYYVYASFNISVYGIQSYRVVGMPDTTYIAGKRVVNYEGVKVYAVYGDPDHTEIEIDASRVTFSDEGVTATAGVKQIPVLVDGKDTQETVTLTVIKNAVTSVEVGGTYDNKYKLNETINFAGLTITLTYLDGTVVTVTDKFTFTGDTTATEALPFRTVTVSLKDDINGDTVSATFPIAVVDTKTVSAFEHSETITAFDADNKNAGKTSYEVDADGRVTNGFNGEFLIGGKTYVIGDDNAFKYMPNFAVDVDGNDQYLTKYFIDVEIYAGSTKLTKVPVKNSTTNYEYYSGTTKIATVDTYNGEYKFEMPLDSVTISIMPSAEYYDVPGDITARTLNAKVIDAYNVYEAWELALYDNSPNDYWKELKQHKGIYGKKVNGLVLHNDIVVTENDVPSIFFTTLTEDVVYVEKDKDGNEIVKAVKKAGTKYLLDVITIYDRYAYGENFVIEGNFFNIDTTAFPYVASNNINVTGPTGAPTDDPDDYNYGIDYSNSVLFRFRGGEDEYIPEELVPSTGVAYFNNIAFKGNAARNAMYAEGFDKDLLSAGGLILLRADRYGAANVDNSTVNSFFIPYLADFGGILTITNSKCFDAYQNAAFATRASKLTIDHSYFNGTGGPVIITQSELKKEFKYNGVTYNDMRFSPDTVITNSVLETHLYGDELWFNALGVSSLAKDIATLGNLGDLGKWTNANGQMNIKAVLMGSGTKAALADCDIEGSLTTDDVSFSRWGDDATWQTIRNYQIPAFDTDGNPVIVNGQLLMVNALENSVPFLTVYYGGQAYTVWTDGKGHLYDLNMRELTKETIYSDTVDPPTEGYNHALIYQAFTTTNTNTNTNEIVLTQGGLSVVLEFYH